MFVKINVTGFSAHWQQQQQPTQPYAYTHAHMHTRTHPTLTNRTKTHALVILSDYFSQFAFINNFTVANHLLAFSVDTNFTIIPSF